MAIIGIDLGTTNSLVCVWRDGKAELVPNSLGEYLTPSAVYADEHQVLWTGGAYPTKPPGQRGLGRA